jgi:hypothetical protein
MLTLAGWEAQNQSLQLANCSRQVCEEMRLWLAVLLDLPHQLNINTSTHETLTRAAGPVVIHLNM